MQAAKKGAYNAFFGLMGQLITIALGIIIPRLVVLSFGSEVNGLLNSMTQIFVCFTLFEAGVGVASLQALYVPVANDDKKSICSIIKATHDFYFKMGIVYASAVTILSLVYPLVVKMKIPYWEAALIIFLGGIGNSLNFLYQGKYRILLQAEGYTYVTTNIATIIGILASGVKLLLLLKGFGVIAVQLSFFLINVLQMIIYYVYVRKHYGWVNLKVEPDTGAISQKNAALVHQVASLIFTNTDVLLLTFITRNLKMVSVYTMYNLVITYVNVLLQQVSTSCDFRLGQMFNTDKKQYLVLHHIFEIIYLIFVFSAMTLVYIFILPFMHLYTAGVTDTNYINKYYPLAFVMVPLLTYGRGAASGAINYAGHFEQTKWRAVAEMIINLTVSIVAVWKFGIFGALMGTVVASLYRTNDIILYVYKYLIPGKAITTYKRWIASFMLFACYVAFVNNDNPKFDSYISIVGYGIVHAVVVILSYTLIQALLNPRERKEFCSIMAGYYRKWRNGKVGHEEGDN